MIRRFSPFILSMACAAPALSQGSSGPGGYCFSDPLATTVYFGSVAPAPNVSLNTSQMTLEFHRYLKARYGFTTNSNYPVSCGVSESVAVAEGNRATLEGQMRGQQKQVVEVDWKYVPSAIAATFLSARGHGMETATALPPPDHGVCFSEAFPAPLYVTGIFDAIPPVSIAQWNMALMKFLSGKYGYKGSVECVMVTVDNAQGLIKAWEDGARGAGRNVVETGWKYDSAANTAPAPHVDEDRQPPHPAAAAPGAPTAALKLANQEGPAVQTYCLQDRTLSVVFDCIRVRRVVHAYRLAHTTGTPELLATLFTGDKLDCTECMDNSKPAAWARRTALAQRMRAPAATCVSQHFVANLKAKPYPNRVQQEFDAAVAACRG